MNKKGLAFGLALLVIASTVVFAAAISQPSLSWSGNTVTAVNPNKKTDLNSIQICVTYKDGEGKRREFTSPSFNLAPKGTKNITAPGEVISASSVSCSVLFDQE